MDIYYEPWCPKCEKPEVESVNFVNYIKAQRYLIAIGEITQKDAEDEDYPEGMIKTLDKHFPNIDTWGISW